MKYCHCDGALENCYFCGGKGWITPSDEAANVTYVAARKKARKQVPEGRVGHVFAPVRTPVPITPASFKVCAQCEARIPSHSFLNHARRCLRKSGPQSAKADPARPSPEMVSKTTPFNMPRVVGNVQFVALTKPIASGSPKIITCAHCLAQLKSSRLASHVARRCPTLKLKRNNISPERPLSGSPDRARASPITEGESTQSCEERRLDATRGTGQVYRDGGRFGSAVVHDRFDDDSDP
jgi:hypothetical protein